MVRIKNWRLKKSLDLESMGFDFFENLKELKLIFLFL
jgi:hypothetical protein